MQAACILHMPVAVAATFFVVELPVGVVAKIVISLALRGAGTIALVVIATHIGTLRRILGLHSAPTASLRVGPMALQTLSTQT